MDLEDQAQSEVFIAHVSYVNAHQRASTMEETKPSKQRESASSHRPACQKPPQRWHNGSRGEASNGCTGLDTHSLRLTWLLPLLNVHPTATLNLPHATIPQGDQPATW